MCHICVSCICAMYGVWCISCVLWYLHGMCVACCLYVVACMEVMCVVHAMCMFYHECIFMNEYLCVICMWWRVCLWCLCCGVCAERGAEAQLGVLVACPPCSVLRLIPFPHDPNPLSSLAVVVKLIRSNYGGRRDPRATPQRPPHPPWPIPGGLGPQA